MASRRRAVIVSLPSLSAVAALEVRGFTFSSPAQHGTGGRWPGGQCQLTTAATTEERWSDEAAPRAWDSVESASPPN